MLQDRRGKSFDLGDHIKACIENAERRAVEVPDPGLKAEYLALAAQWTHLAGSYEFSESLERFLLDSQKAKDALSSATAGSKVDRVSEHNVADLSAACVPTSFTRAPVG